MQKKCGILFVETWPVNHAYYVATATGLQKAERGERPEFWLNNRTSNTTMLQHSTMSVKHFQVRHPQCVVYNYNCIQYKQTYHLFDEVRTPYFQEKYSTLIHKHYLNTVIPY